MPISQKCQYALRSLFELARSNGRSPVKISAIAGAQAIPQRFLEVILSELKQGGFVESRRGKKGGYLMARIPEDLTVGEIIRFVEGPLGPVACVLGESKNNCRLYADCVFRPMWDKVRTAVSEVYDNTTFQNLVDQHKQKAKQAAPCYSI